MKDKKIIIFFDSNNQKKINAFTYLLKNIDLKKYQIDLLIEENIKIKVSKKINIIKYKQPKNKLQNLFLKHTLKYKFLNKYDTTLIYTMDSLLGNYLLKKSSKNKIIIIDFKDKPFTSTEKYREYFMKRNIYDFEQIIFKNNQDLEEFIKHYPSLSKKTTVINDLINYEEIEKLSNEDTEEKIKRTDTNLLLIDKLNEESSQILKKIKIIKKLKKEIPNIKLYIIGNGIDKYAYETYIEDNNLTDTIYILGDKTNPYPYLKKCKYILISNSNIYKKYFLPSLMLKTQVISTINIQDDITNNQDLSFNISNENYETELKDILINKKKKNIKIDFKKCNQGKIEKIENIL